MWKPGLILLLTIPALLAQTPDASLTFDVASIKPAPPLPSTMGGRGVFRFGGLRGGPGSDSPGQATGTGVSMMNLLLRAYGVKPYQIVGPDWMRTELYDVAIKVPPDITKEQFNIMLQNLLVERFHMVIKRETKELPIYALVVARNGPKLKESQLGPPPPPDPNKPPPGPPTLPMKMGADGFPDFPKQPGRPSYSMVMMNGRAKMTATGEDIEMLASNLSNQVSRPVHDETGLKGKYDFTLIWQPDNINMPAGRGSAADSSGPGGGAPSTSAEAELPTLFTALQSQLGLRLEAKKGPVEQLIIESLNKVPADN